MRFNPFRRKTNSDDSLRRLLTECREKLQQANDALNKSEQDKKRLDAQLKFEREYLPKQILFRKYCGENRLGDNYTIPLRGWFEEIAEQFARFQKDQDTLNCIRRMLIDRIPYDAIPGGIGCENVIDILLARAGFPSRNNGATAGAVCNQVDAVAPMYDYSAMHPSNSLREKANIRIEVAERPE